MQETDQPSGVEKIIIKEQAGSRTRGWKHFWLYFLAGSVYLVDQFVKFWTEQTLSPPNSGKSIELLGGFFRFIYIKNSGASFGMLKDAPWLFAILAIAASIGIILWYEIQGTNDNWFRLGVGFILGGVVGNLSDRLFKGGSVTDMLNFPGIELFKIFNVADSAITIGVITILLDTLLRTAEQYRSEKSALQTGKARSEHERNRN